MSPTGEPVVDKRLPYFDLPDWVPDPFGQNDGGVATGSHADKRAKLGGQYKVEKALYFSTAGGVYLAEDTRTGRKVVVKEARPYTGVDFFANDAVSMRQREWEILNLLQDTGVVPRPLDLFWEWEHCFLVETHEEGRDIREILLKESPFVRISPRREDSERYYDIYRQLFLSFLEGLDVVHARGIVLGDLSANNLIITDDYDIRFLDLEGAFRIGVDKPTGLYTHGFRDPHRVIRGQQDFKDDLYTMGTLMTYMLFPVNAMANLRTDVYRGLVSKLVRDLGWPSEIAALITDLIGGKASYDDVRTVLQRKRKVRPPQFICGVTEDKLRRIVAGMGQFILRNIRDNDYQLCPSDPFVFLTNPLSLGLGAIGVLHSLRKCGCEISEKAWQYLDAKLSAVGISDYPPGLLTGIAGIAWGAWQLERQEAAEELMQFANTHPLLKNNHSLYYGMAGVGLANLYFWLKTGKGYFLDWAVDLGNELMQRARQDDEKGLFWENDGMVRVGLGYGQSGVALFLLRLSQITGNHRARDVGQQALNYDLCWGREVEKGVVSYPNTPSGSTLEPYLEEGTAGIVKVLLRYGMVGEAERLSSDLCRKYSISASYLFGLAGLVDALVDLHLFTGDDKYMRLAKRPLAGITDLYLLETKNGLATPGDSGLAISCDFGTGVAGVMRVLHRYLMKDESDFMLDELNRGRMK